MIDSRNLGGHVHPFRGSWTTIRHELKKQGKTTGATLSMVLESGTGSVAVGGQHRSRSTYLSHTKKSLIYRVHGGYISTYAHGSLSP